MHNSAQCKPVRDTRASGSAGSLLMGLAASDGATAPRPRNYLRLRLRACRYDTFMHEVLKKVVRTGFPHPLLTAVLVVVLQ